MNGGHAEGDKWWLSSSFVRHVSQLMGGTVAGQIIALLLVPIVARLFGPESFGVAASVLALASTLAMFSTLRYQQAVVVARKALDAEVLMRLGIGLVFFLMLLELMTIELIIWLFPTKVDAWLAGNDTLIFAAPLIAMMTGLTYMFNACNNRSKAFKRMGGAVLARSVAVPGTRIVLGSALGASPVWLVIGMGLGLLTEAWLLGQKYIGQVLQGWREDIISGRMWQIAKKYHDFPCYSAPEALLHNLSTQLPVYFLAIMYAPAIVGFYAIAIRLVRMPALAINKSVREVYLQKCSELRSHNRSLVAPFMKATTTLFLLGLGPFLLLLGTADFLFGVLLGESWQEAGRYAVLLAPWIFAGLVSVPAQVTFVAFRRQDQWLRFQFGLLLARLSVFVIGFWGGMKAQDVVALFSLVSTIFNLLAVVVAFYLVKREALIVR